MQSIFSPGNRAVLSRFMFNGTLLAFDFDGTLVPLVSKPDAARIKPRTRRLLADLASRRPCIVVSGRRRSDIRSRLTGVPLVEFIGNHGIEPGNSSRAVANKVALWSSFLHDSLKNVPGVVLEDKCFSLSLHYRKARNKSAARAAILRAVRSLPGVKLIGGKQVVNVLPEESPDKGDAVELERKRRKLGSVLYVGDDETDERAFAFEKTGRYLTIRVGKKDSSLARFHIRNQKEIDRLLRLLLALSAPAAGDPRVGQ
jgi:trehalose 6-phosphate phosphatase